MSILYECPKHGVVKHYERKGGKPKCAKCDTEYVMKRIRKVKQILVEEAGGACIYCGYNECIQALHFHHRDPAVKEFGISGGSKSLDRQRIEAQKCDLVCSNCHVELHYQASDL